MSDQRPSLCRLHPHSQTEVGIVECRSLNSSSEQLLLRHAVLLNLLWLLAVPSVTWGQARVAALDSLIQAEVDHDRIGGAVLQIVYEGTVLHRQTYGYAQRYAYGRDLLPSPDSMSTAHLFDLASLTKVFATTFALMLLVDQNRVALDDPVVTYLPEFNGGGKEHITLRHLLTHTSGLAPWVPLYYHAATPEATYAYISRLPLKYEVGAARHYSDLGFMLLGYLVERVTQQRLDFFLQEHLYGPLGLAHTTFVPLERGFGPQQIVATSHGNPFERRMVYDDSFGYECEEDPTAWDGWRHHTLRGEVNDGNAYHANEGIAGHAGLFSTVDDLQQLVNLLLEEGRYQDKAILSAETVGTFLEKDAHGNALGWAMDPAIIQSRGAPAGTFGHTGFTGTNVVIMPSYGLSLILLTNRQNVDVNEDGYYPNLNPTRQALISRLLALLGQRDPPK